MMRSPMWPSMWGRTAEISYLRANGPSRPSITIAMVIHVNDIRGLPSRADVSARNPAMMPSRVSSTTFSTDRIVAYTATCPRER